MTIPIPESDPNPESNPIRESHANPESQPIPESDPGANIPSRPERPAPAVRRNRPRVTIPSVDEILGQLIGLNGAVAIGALSTKDANLMHKNLRVVLDTQLKRANREDVGPGQEGLVELCRDNPRTLNALAPFLTEDQLEDLLRAIEDSEGETV
jgi:hypothetical protein